MAIEIGQKYGDLVVSGTLPSAHGHKRYLVVCACGDERELYGWQLTQKDRPARACVRCTKEKKYEVPVDVVIDWIRKRKGGFTNLDLYQKWGYYESVLGRIESHGVMVYFEDGRYYHTEMEYVE